MSELVVETRDLRRTFGKDGAIEAVAGVDLRVEAGSIFGFLGPNGAGKTTTLRILATLLPPTSGVARVMGVDVATRARGGPAPDRLRRPERRLRPPDVRPRRARHAGPAVRPLDGRPARARAGSCSTRWTSPRPATAPIDTYSGGMRRRLDVALGMVHRPGLLFLDEPTTGLDPQARARMWDEVRRAPRRAARRVFLTTHYLDEADALCDRLAIIDHGRIVAEGTSDELKRAVAGRRRHDRRRRLGPSSSPASLEAPAVRPRGEPRRRRRPAVRRRRRGEPPARPAAARRPGPRAPDARAPPPQPRRRLPPPDRPLAARRSRLSADHPTTRKERPVRLFSDSWLVFRRSPRPHRPPARVARRGRRPAVRLPPPVRPAAQQPGRRARLPARRRVQRVRPGLLVMTALFGSTFVGFGFIDEMRHGVVERMRVTPMSRHGVRPRPDACATSACSGSRA